MELIKLRMVFKHHPNRRLIPCSSSSGGRLRCRPTIFKFVWDSAKISTLLTFEELTMFNLSKKIGDFTKKIVKRLESYSRKNCVMFSISGDYMFAVANIIIAIQKCNPKLITKYIIYESEDFPVAQSDKRIIEKLFPSLIEFRTYTPPQKNITKYQI